MLTSHYSKIFSCFIFSNPYLLPAASCLLCTWVDIINHILMSLNIFDVFIFTKLLKQFRALSQILVLGRTGRARSSWVVAPGAGFCGQNLMMKYIPYIGTHFWITMPAKYALSSTKCTHVTHCIHPYMNNNACQICCIQYQMYTRHTLHPSIYE